MSKVTGVLLVVAGVSIAAYQLSAGTKLGPQVPLPESKIAKSPAAATIALAAVTEPQRVDPPPSKPAPATPKPKPTAAQAAASTIRPTPPAPTAASGPQAWPPFVTQVQRENERFRLAQTPAQMPTPRPVIAPGDRVSLARELQRELKRVGCYDGEINSTWTTSTRRAMKAFTDRVNATLPIEEPDQVLLALVQSHQDNVCGKSCPAGQGLSEAGRCLPNAILARAATKGSARLAVGTPPKGKAPEGPPPIVSWSTTTTLAAPARVEPAPEGRMALAGPHQAEGSSLPSAEPMPSAGVSLLPGSATSSDAAQQHGAVPPSSSGGYYEPPRAPRQVQGSGGSSWSRTFYKRRDSVF